jgi:hypothetical protein
VIHPASHRAVVEMLVEDFGMEPKPAAKAATKICKSLERLHYEVIAQGWENRERPSLKWDDLARAADSLVEERNGIPPWRSPELL